MLEYWDHEVCIVDEIVKLMMRGFRCYLEHNVSEDKKKSRGIFVDIFAKRGAEEIIIEVGTCYHLLEEYKKAKQNAKIIFVHQWKNYGMNGDVLWRFGREHKRILFCYSNFPDFRDSLLRDLDNKIWDLDRRVAPWI